MCAADEGHRDTVKLLLQQGADANAKGDKGQTSLTMEHGMVRETLLNYFFNMAPLLMQMMI